ncbi:MAG TPA: hypothetical protein VFP80_16525, partial [Thermoanaerobaculia bacterium]|nr:hypothetical protein [Thermoanaerobaculia bacterium]
LRELQEDADFYGVLVPLDAAATLKAVARATAELFLSLSTPAYLGIVDDDAIDLVLDGILEAEHDDRFVSGIDAFPLFFPSAEDRAQRAEETGPSFCALPSALRPLSPAQDTLSTEALRHAEELEASDAGTLTNALYSYNRLPRTRAWVTRFPDRDSVLAHLGHSPLLARHWALVPEERSRGWISWAAIAGTPATADHVTWKLYVSPRPEHVREAFHALVRVLAEIPGSQMKIGPDAAGLLRPDKLVAYFASKAELDTAAAALANELRGCPAHGVPFTAAVDEHGLMSWGADPPDSERALSWLDRESWRLWIVKSLASALAVAKRSAAPPVPPWRFAMERVRRLGVHVDTWTPADTLWRPVA